MNIELLRITNLRCFESTEFAPAPGTNWLVGANGAGKTTLLEAAYILSHGRSFRGGSRAAPRRHGADEFLIHVEIATTRGGRHKLGIRRRDEQWQARLDGETLASLAPLFAACPVVCFGPESVSLILGAAEERRNFLDWSVFHVEHGSLLAWRQWRRALRQRNALLRERAPDADFEPWERELERLASRIDRLRRDCLASLEPFIRSEAAHLVPELGEVRIRYRPGWNEDHGLADQFAASRSDDRERGYTQLGAHRADWVLQFDRIARRDHLSRGQAKAAALVCLLAQTRWLNEQLGEYPLLCLDDVGSELDAPHIDAVAGWVTGKPIQVWITATEAPVGASRAAGAAVFHVEHSGCTRA